MPIPFPPSAEAALSALRSAIEALVQDYADLEVEKSEALTELEATIQGLEQELATAQLAVANFQTEKNSLEGNIAELQDKVRAALALIADLEKRLNEALKKIAELTPGPSDDFSSGVLNSFWTFAGPAGTSYSPAGGSYLDLITPDGDFDAWNANTAARVMQAVGNKDFTIAVKFLSTPSIKYQGHGILVEESASRWLRFDTYSDGNKLNAFSCSTTNNASTFKFSTTASGASYLRLSRVGNLWTFSCSPNGTTWTTAGSYAESITAVKVGIFASNSETAAGYIARVDYVEFASDPLTPTPAPTLPSITLACSPASAQEDGSANLVYTFTRNGNLSGPLTVSYTCNGSAIMGSDYNAMSPTVTFQPGSSTATVTVDPIVDSTSEPDETVVLALAAGTGYTVGTPSSATGTIANDDAAPPAAPAWFTRNGSNQLVVNSGPTLGSLTFTQELTGAAGNYPPLSTAMKNRVLYNNYVDGYEGRPLGSCRTRGQCPIEDYDLVHPLWSPSDLILHMLIKNWHIKNAFKTSAPPHVDIMQIHEGGQTGGWLGFQDCTFKNSDDGILQMQYLRPAGVVMQGVRVTQEFAFVSDAVARNTINGTDGVVIQGNHFGTWTPNTTTLWLIDFNNTPTASSHAWPITLQQNWAKVIVVGIVPVLLERLDVPYNFTVQTAPTGGRASLVNGKCFYYPNLEAAIADGHTEPPFVRHSLAGWANPSVNAPAAQAWPPPTGW